MRKPAIHKKSPLAGLVPQECPQACRGVMARRIPLDTQMGLGHDRFDPALGAWASEFRMSEANHRRFYGRWAEVMAAKNWGELADGAAREAQHA